MPPSVQLPGGVSVVTFPTVKGKVTARMGSLPYKGPGGDEKGETDITSYGGISGIVDRRHGQFLVGVFLTDDPPANFAPRRLDFTKHERFRTLAPRVGQTFFVGDGRDRTFRVPPGATRLFLGFADAFSLGESAREGLPRSSGLLRQQRGSPLRGRQSGGAMNPQRRGPHEPRGVRRFPG
jgi:hypothetical protein